MKNILILGTNIKLNNAVCKNWDEVILEDADYESGKYECPACKSVNELNVNENK